MDQLQTQLEVVKSNWTAVYEALKNSPSTVAPHLNGANLEQINEVVEVVSKYMGRVRAPKGFQPSFHLAKSVAITTLPLLTSSSASLQKGEYNFFPTFIGGLNQILSALHSLHALSDERDSQTNISIELTEKLALLDTAQTELKNKVDSLKAADTAAAKVEELATHAKEFADKTEEIWSGIKDVSSEAADSLKEIEEHASNYAAKEGEIDLLLKELKKLQGDLDSRNSDLKVITEKAAAQEELIDSLLPKGASVGLASAFHGRVKSMEGTKLIWLVIFLVSIAGLIGTGIWITNLASGSKEIALWEATIHKLPLLAPLIWLGWFSAIQYGNSLRVQEDYAFKEATSNAFQGYRDHMEHLATVKGSDAQTALALLSAQTIKILGEEPLRVFQKNERDASPSSSLKELFSKNREKVKNSEEEI